MRVRLIIEKELESLWGAEDLLEDHSGVATKEFCKDLLELSIMEDISSYIFPNGEPQYDPLIVLEVVDTKQTNNTPLVVELNRTCHACPSQWEGQTEDGKHVYIRYRWGFLSAQVGTENIYGASHGDSLHGEMSNEDMMKALSSVLRFADGLLE